MQAWTTTALVSAVAIVTLASGCDARATASEPAGSRAEQKSREYESCSASAACAEGLRCVEAACRRTARSTVGDYHAAAGALARGRGDLEAAVAAYAEALAQYDGERVAPPPDLECAYGATLAAARSKKERAELAARVLHRCVLATPAGSRIREHALQDLASLAEAGLDPALLAGPKLADLYLTKPATRPAAERLTVTVAPAPAPTGKSFALIPEKLAGPDLRSPLVACWTAYNAQSHKDALTVTIGVKSSYIASDYDDEPGSYAIRYEAPAGLPAGSPEAAADACVRQVVEPAIKALKLADAFTTKLAITIR